MATVQTSVTRKVYICIGREGTRCEKLLRSQYLGDIERAFDSRSQRGLAQKEIDWGYFLAIARFLPSERFLLLAAPQAAAVVWRGIGTGSSFGRHTSHFFGLGGHFLFVSFLGCFRVFFFFFFLPLLGCTRGAESAITALAVLRTGIGTTVVRIAMRAIQPKTGTPGPDILKNRYSVQPSEKKTRCGCFWP